MPPRVVLGVSGGIAAYKAVEVCRRLVDAGVHVTPVLTHNESCAGSEANAEKVTAPTKRVASWVRTGVTCTPASTRRRQTSTAL